MISLSPAGNRRNCKVKILANFSYLNRVLIYKLLKVMKLFKRCLKLPKIKEVH